MRARAAASALTRAQPLAAVAMPKAPRAAAAARRRASERAAPRAHAGAAAGGSSGVGGAAVGTGEGGAGVVRHSLGGVVRGTLHRRYKRFLADVELDPAARGLPGADANAQAEEGGGVTLTVVHCPNTGPMTGLLDSLPAPCLLSHHPSKTRKYAFSLAAIEVDGTWVGVNSARANDVVGTAVAAGLLDAPLAMGAGGVRRGAVRREVKCGDDGKSRRDFVVERLPADGGGDAQDVHLEVKAVTLTNGEPSAEPGCEGGLVALFPDTVSKRASKHTRELIEHQHAASASSRGRDEAGMAAAAVMLILRGDCSSYCPADDCDPAYGALVRSAALEGVGVLPLRAALSLEGEADAHGMRELIVDVRPDLAPLESRLWEREDGRGREEVAAAGPP